MFFSRVRVPVATYNNTWDIAIALEQGQRWREDPLNGRLDTLTHPTRVQKRINENARGFEDCDGHAAYWCVSLLKSGLAQRAWFAFYQMEHNESGKISGHAVCVFQDGNGVRYWADYRKPTEWNEPFEWAEQSAERFNSTMFAAGMIEIKDINKNDSLKWGKWTSCIK